MAVAFAAVPANAARASRATTRSSPPSRPTRTRAIERCAHGSRCRPSPTWASTRRKGAEYMRQLALDAGFQQAKVVETDGVPGVFATLDAGAKHTLAIYFMYDVKHYDPAEWSSPPLEGRIVERPGEGQGAGRPRRGQPEGPADGLPHRAPCVQGRASSCRSTSSSSPRARRKSARPTFQRILANPEVRRRSRRSAS